MHPDGPLIDPARLSPGTSRLNTGQYADPELVHLRRVDVARRLASGEPATGISAEIIRYGRPYLAAAGVTEGHEMARE